MTITTSIILVVAVIAVATLIAYSMQKGTKAMSDFKADFDNNDEVEQLVDLAKELYNKDLRPTPVKKAPKKKKSEFPIDQPAKKEKVKEVASQDITPEVINKVVEIAKIEPEIPTTPVNVEPAVEVIKPKKKRKYYPKKPKTSI